MYCLETWIYRHYRPDQEVVLESLDITLSFADIYAQVRVPVENNDMP